jgi:hypothetical protein
MGLYNNAVPLEDFKVPREAPKKPCVHCGRDMVDTKEAQLPKAEGGVQEQGVPNGQGTHDVEMQDAPDVTNG